MIVRVDDRPDQRSGVDHLAATVIVAVALDDERDSLLAQRVQIRILGRCAAQQDRGVLPADLNNDNVADNMDLDELLDGSVQYTTTGVDIDLEFPMLVDDFDQGIVTVVGDE